MRDALGCLGLLVFLVTVCCVPKAFSPTDFAFLWWLPPIASLMLAIYGATGPKPEPRLQDKISTLAIYAWLAAALLFVGFHLLAPGFRLHRSSFTGRDWTVEFAVIANWSGGGLFGLGLILALVAFGVEVRDRHRALTGSQSA